MYRVFLVLSLLYGSLHGGERKEEDVVVLGSGVAGLTAALYLAQGGAHPLVITGDEVGGAITQSACVRNWPGAIAISGTDLAEQLRAQAQKSGVRFVHGNVERVDFSAQPLLISVAGAPPVRAKQCLIATGSIPNKLGVPGESDYWAKGVYSCAICDGPLYADKRVAVVGGGSAAVTEGLYLSQIAKKVYLLVRGKKIRSTDHASEQELLACSNVEVLYNTEVASIYGDEEKVAGAMLKNGETLPVEAIFLAVGAKPNTLLFRNQIALDERGFIRLDEGQRTSVRTVFAAGDVVQSPFKQAIISAGEGAYAALQMLPSCFVSQRMDVQSSPLRGIRQVQSEEELAQALSQSPGLTWVDFYSPHCPPCRALSPLYAGWAEEFGGRALFLKVDVSQASGLAQKYQIRQVPTVLALDLEGKIVERAVGLGAVTDAIQRCYKAPV